MSNLHHITLDEMRQLLPKRANDSHKGTFGEILLIAGSKIYPGAALLAARAAVRSGVGLVNLAVPVGLRQICAVGVPEAILHPLAEDAEGGITPASIKTITTKLQAVDCVAVGMGLGRTNNTTDFIKALLQTCPKDKNTIFDADALFALHQIPNWHAHTSDNLGKIIITPHPGEMAHLLNLETAQIQADRQLYAEQATKKFGTTTVLKGANTLIAAPNELTAQIPYANSGMAKGGSGDVLAGLMAGIAPTMPQNSPHQIATFATYLHGLAAELATKAQGTHATTPSDTIDNIGNAFLYLQNGANHK